MSEPILESFREELLALLQSLEADLLDLEGGEDPDGVGKVFRGAHNIKSAAAMLGLTSAAEATHALESVLEAIREGERQVDRATVTHLLGGVDALRALIQGEPSPPAPAEARPAPASSPRRVRLALALDDRALARALDPLALLQVAGELGKVEEAKVDLSRLPDLRALEPERLYLAFELVLVTSASLDELRGALLFAEGSGTVELAELPAARAVEARELPEGCGATTLVVPARRVDALVDLSAELLVASSRVEHLRQEGIPTRDGRMENACREVQKLASRIQEAAMAIRLVPLEPTFVMLRRFIRETSARLGKEVEVVLEGGQTELDRSVAERLLDPLKHLARNALDHGIEPPGERLAAGKVARGRLLLAARQEQGQVVLAVEDDGRGVDPSRVRVAAGERGLLVPGAELSEAEALRLIFQPGFSTAPQAGELSGRGVGLDVVRRNLVDLGGDLQVESQVGRGTGFTLRVPLTLAVLEGLVVGVDGERLVVPLDEVEQLLSLRAGQVARLPDGRVVLQLPDRTVPLVRPLAAGCTVELARRGIALVTSSSAGRVALQVDEVLSQEPVLLKPLHRELRMGGGLLGAAVLGDGRVALVLDLARLLGREMSPCSTEEVA